MRLARMAAGALVGVAVLAGCSSEQPANETLPSVAPTSAEASETLPPLGPPDFPMPAEAREKDGASAEQFVRYYVELINRAQGDLRPEHLAVLSDGCETCDQLMDGLESFRNQGYSYKGGTISLGDVSVGATTEPLTPFTASFRQASVEVVDRSGQPVPGYVAPDATYSASGGALRWDPRRHTWLMNELTIA